jgi:hypothetical protein
MNILGYNYKLVHDRSSDIIDANGRLHTATKTIQIANDIADQEVVSTILHEIIEGINHHLELNLEHNTIACLETALYQVFTTNGIDLSPLQRELK